MRQSNVDVKKWVKENELKEGDSVAKKSLKSGSPKSLLVSFVLLWAVGGTLCLSLHLRFLHLNEAISER